MSNPLDTKVISKLAEILDKSNLTELEYEDEGCRICLTRDFSGRMVMPSQMQMSQVSSMSDQMSSLSTSSTELSADISIDYSKSAEALKSPMVGVVYLASDPNTPDYVKIGSMVTEGDTVCLIEAMKTFNPVKAHKSGKVTKILVSGGDPVEYGEPLIIIE